jgi:hypothetical protein
MISIVIAGAPLNTLPCGEQNFMSEATVLLSVVEKGEPKSAEELMELVYHHDGVYGPAVNLIQSGQHSNARFIGHQAETLLEWQINRHFTFSADYAHFFAGEFLEQTTPGKDVDYTSAWLTFKF